MERMTYRGKDGRARLTLLGKLVYGSTQATADCVCKLEEALEAQQKARVLTVEELWKLRRGDVVWVEEAIPRKLQPEIVRYVEAVEDPAHWLEIQTTDICGYYERRLTTAPNWRCWNRKPTRKQREAISWN